MSLVKRLWKRPPAVAMSYPQLLSDCTQHYDAPAPSDISLRVPPWPVQADPTKEEVAALEKHMLVVKEEARARKVPLDELGIDAVTVLTALMEGREGGEVLGEGAQEAGSVSNVSPPHAAVSHPPQETGTSDTSSSSDSSSSSSSSEYPTSEHTKARKKLLSSTSERNHSTTTTTSSSTDSKEVSSGANSEHRDTKHKSPSTECKNRPFVFSDGQRRITPPSGHVLPPHSTRDTGPNREHPQSATGTRPKDERKQQKEENKTETKDQKSYHNQKSKKKREPTTNSYSGYGEWVPVDKEDEKKCQDQSQPYDQGYEEQDHPSQAYNQGYQNYNQWYQGYYQEDQGYEQEYQNYNQNYEQEYEAYNQAYQPSYYHGYNHYYPNTGTATHGHTPNTHTNAYIESACKFASMMEYVTTMGRVSLQVALDYHSRNKEWQRQQGRHSNAP